MEQQGKNRLWGSILCSLLIAVSAYAVIYKCFSMVYAINDDVAMRDIASGAMTGKPDGHLIFIKYALGLLISGMYRIFPGIDWYGLLMSGLIMICLAIVLYRGLSDIQNRRDRVLYVLLIVFMFSCTVLQHVVFFQWTITAGIAGATGVFLLYTSPEQDRLRSTIEEIIAAVLLILTFCIRNMVLLMLLPAAVICYFFKYVRINRGKRRFSIQHVWFWPLVLLGCAIVMLIETSAYQEEEWKGYKEFNAYRAEYYDYDLSPSFEKNQDFYASIDMEEEEVKALKNYSFFLVDGIYEYKMKEIVHYAKSEDSFQKGILTRLRQGVQSVYKDFEASTYAPLSWIVMFAIIIAMIIFWKRRSSQSYLLLACLGMQLVLWCYLGFQSRIVERVSFAMHIYMLFLTGAILYRELLGCSVEGVRSCRGQKLIVVSCGVLFLLMIALEWSEIRENSNWQTEKNEEKTELCKYMDAHKENIYLLHTFSVSHYTDNFRIRKDFEMHNYMSMGGWQSFSPVERERAEFLGISDMEEALYRGENVYAISREDTSYIEQCLEAKYGSCHSEEVEVIKFKDDTYRIERFGEYKEIYNSV